MKDAFFVNPGGSRFMINAGFPASPLLDSIAGHAQELPAS
jgi:hypothetical protein